MKKKHTAKRKDYPDTRLMDALDANDYNITEAAKSLGLPQSTFRNWMTRSPALNEYIKYRQAEQALAAREKLQEVLGNMDTSDPKQASIAVSVCKILLDKFEHTLSRQDVNTTVIDNTVNQNLINDFLKK